MIESKYWKKDLLELSKLLKKQAPIKRWSEKLQVNFEKEIIMKFFLVRKLAETHKISDSLKKELHEIIAYPKTDKYTTPWNQYDFDEHFEMEKPKVVLKDLIFICNQLIHSLIIFAFTEDKKWSYIMTCSDFEFSKYIYKIDVLTIAKIFKQIGENYPRTNNTLFKEKTNKFNIKVE